ncbi:sigma-70 family RNA polymerase sigma factor [candidate division KSB1 bacterium]|nr:sigma-70 family RNA polymerase sigma factor [candidate division KSB1 bacterium]
MNDTITSPLLNHREKLLAYVRKKISDPDLAEDILQDSLLKALRAAPDLRDEDKLVPWFYRILNNAITDAYRRRHVEAKYMERPTEFHEPPAEPEPEDEATLCTCFRELIPTLKPEYAELIEKMELSDGDPALVAEQLGINRNNLKVRRHRARQALRERLEETCRVCAKHGCLDCSCRHG